MTVLIDTNVVMDILLGRQPFVVDSRACIEFMLRQQYHLFISATAITDLFYLLRKTLGDKRAAQKALVNLFQIVQVADTLADDIAMAMDSRIADFEDAVVDSIGTRMQTTFIVTRNKKDFAASKNVIKTPTEVLSGMTT